MKTSVQRCFLLVDDHAHTRALMSRRLERAGVRVTSVSSAAEALELAAHETFDAVVSDVLMPEMDGFQLTQALRRLPLEDHVPIVLVSGAYTTDGDVALAQQMGATALVFRGVDLAPVVEKILSYTESPAEPITSSPAAPVDEMAYDRRVHQQLDRQTVLNLNLSERIEWLEANLNIFQNITRLGIEAGDTESLLRQMLLGSLDASGLSRGAVFVAPPEGEPILQAQVGYRSDELPALGSFFGRMDLLRTILESEHAMELVHGNSGSGDVLLAQIGVGNLLLTPLTVGDSAVGVLVTGSEFHEVSEGWRWYADALGAQMSQVISLNRALEQVRDSQARLDRIVQTDPTGIMITDPTGVITMVNPAAARIFSLPMDEVVGRRPMDFRFPVTLHGSAEPLQPGELTARLIKGGTSVHDILATFGLRREIVVSISAAPLQDTSGRVTGTVIALTDVSRSQQQQRLLAESEERFRLLAENSSDMIARHSPDGVFRYVSPTCQALIGYTPDELIGLSPYDFIHPEDMANVAHSIRSVENGRMEEPFVVRFRRKDGSYIWLETTARSVGSGEDRELQSATRDVSRRKAVEIELERRIKQQMAATALSRLAVTERDIQVLLDEVARSMSETLDVPFSRVMKLDPVTHDLLLVAGVGWEDELIGSWRVPGDEGTLAARVLQSAEPVVIADLNQGGWIAQQPIVQQHGATSSMGMVIPGNGQPWGLLAVNTREQREFSRDDAVFLQQTALLVSSALQRVQAETALTYEGLHDPVTGLPNRTLLVDRLQQAMLAAERAGSGVAVAVVNINHFKDINDAYGRETGDRILREIGLRLEGTIRESDTVGRLGGDEFCVILSGTDEMGARQAVAALQMSLAVPVVVDGHAIEVQPYIGISLSPDHADEVDRLLQCADVALRSARAHQVPTVVYSVAEVTSEVRFVQASALRRAIQHGELLLEYQPKADLHTRGIIGVEALVRWEHPLLGRIPPDGFIPLAEEWGLMPALTRWVLNEAVRQCRSWRNVGIDLPVGVNITSADLLDRGFVSSVRELLETWEIDPGMLDLEITESILMANPEKGLETIHELRGLGVTLSIDDFGTGYSSLVYLKNLPVNTVKIDRTFISELSTDSSDLVIVHSVIGLGHNLNLSVVAEGIEDAGALDLLAQAGCDQAQGYFISRPLPADEMIPYLERRQGAFSVAS